MNIPDLGKPLRVNKNYNKNSNTNTYNTHNYQTQLFDLDNITESYLVNSDSSIIRNNSQKLLDSVNNIYNNGEGVLNISSGKYYIDQTTNPLNGSNKDMLNLFSDNNIKINCTGDTNNPTIIKVALDSDPTCTRAQAIEMIYKIAGSPNVDRNLPFEDIEENGWYSDALKWAYELGITCGTSSKTFSPDRVITRGELDILLGRFNDISSNCKIDIVSKFDEVKDFGSYKDEIEFAVNSGVMNLNSLTEFGSGDVLNRADVLQYFYKYAGSPQNDSSNLLESINNANEKGNNFADLNKYEDINIFDSVLWGVNNGIVSKSSSFNPESECKRSQAIVMLYRMAGSPEVSGTIPFNDVDDDSWYNDALTWAYKSGIIKGTTSTTFSPEKTLSKNEMAIILKRFNDYNNGVLEPEKVVKYSTKATEGDFKNYYQTDYNDKYGTGTISSSGCGPTSMAMVLTKLTGEEITPPEAAQWSLNHGYRIPYQGTANAYFGAMAEEYDVNCIQMTASSSNIEKSLNDGELIILNVGPGHFTSGGHFIVLRGIDEDGNVIISDPASSSKSAQTWSSDLLAREARTMFVLS